MQQHKQSKTGFMKLIMGHEFSIEPLNVTS
jgi:hypothetical protein